jgi:DNA-binding transcriptional regulator YhcF (GntR family)
MDQVTRMIVSGELAEGAQLESVAGLAGRLKINPMTISKAYGFLVESGLIERRPGVGLFVRAVANDRKRKVKETLLAEALGRSAAMAAQLGLDEQAAVGLFVEQFRQTKSQREAEE